MSYQDVTDLFGIVEGIVDTDGMGPRKTEYKLDALRFEHFNNGLAAGDQRHVNLLIRVNLQRRDHFILSTASTPPIPTFSASSSFGPTIGKDVGSFLQAS